MSSGSGSISYQYPKTSSKSRNKNNNQNYIINTSQDTAIIENPIGKGDFKFISIHFTTTSSIKNDRVNGIYFSVDNISIDGLYNEQRIGLNFTIHYLTNQPGIYENGFQTNLSSSNIQFSDFNVKPNQYQSNLYLRVIKDIRYLYLEINKI